MSIGRPQPPTQTVRFRLGSRPLADTWFHATQRRFNQVAAFYFAALESHPAVLELSDQATLTALEHLTHATRKNPAPRLPLSETVRGDIPAMFRRAAIHAALGSARSFHSNLERWRQQKAKAEAKARARGRRSAFHQRPPVPPRKWKKSVIFYQGQHKQFTGETILLRV